MSSTLQAQVGDKIKIIRNMVNPDLSEKFRRELPLVYMVHCVDTHPEWGHVYFFSSEDGESEVYDDEFIVLEAVK